MINMNSLQDKLLEIRGRAVVAEGLKELANIRNINSTARKYIGAVDTAFKQAKLEQAAENVALADGLSKTQG